MDVMRTWWTRSGIAGSERGATAVEWVMLAALVVAAVVLAATLGTAWAGDVV